MDMMEDAPLRPGIIINATIIIITIIITNIIIIANYHHHHQEGHDGRRPAKTGQARGPD